MPLDTLDGLASLADKSLLTVVPSDHGETLFGRHAFVREFALEQLQASGERPGCERRRAEDFRDLAVTAGDYAGTCASPTDRVVVSDIRQPDPAGRHQSGGW